MVDLDWEDLLFEEIPYYGILLVLLFIIINKLSEIDTIDIEPLININNHEQVLRSDKTGNMLSNDAALINTKHNSGVYFTVPKVLK